MDGDGLNFIDTHLIKSLAALQAAYDDPHFKKTLLAIAAT